MPNALTFRQKQIMDCVMRHWNTHLVGPSIRDLVFSVEWCSSTSHMHHELQELITAKYLARPNNRARSLIPLRDCDGVKIAMYFRRADGVEVQLGSQSSPHNAR